MLCADSQAPGAKSGGGSLLLIRERCSRRLPQSAARAAAFCDNAGGDGGLAQDSSCTPWQSAGEQRGVARGRGQHGSSVPPQRATSRRAGRRTERPQPPADEGVLPHAARENRVWNASTSFLMFEGRRPLVPLVTRMWTWAKFFGIPIIELFEEFDDTRAKVHVLAAGTQLVQHLFDDLMRPLYTKREVPFSLEIAEPT